MSEIVAANESWQGDLERLRRTQTSRGRAQSGTISIEGFRLHERALRAGRLVELALVGTAVLNSDSRRAQDLLAALQEAGTRLVEVPDEVIQVETGGRDLGALLGLLARPPQPSMSALLRGTARPLFLAAVDIREPGNVGALARTAHAAGATAFLASGASDPFHPKALRTSMGSLLKLPVRVYDQTDHMLEELGRAGIQRVGMAVSEGVALPRAAFPAGSVAVLAGNEAWGLAEAVQAAVDQLVYIPMAPGVDSYSVNAAAAIVLYEVRRAELSDHIVAAAKQEGQGSV